MNKVIDFFSNRYILAAMGFLFVLSFARRFAGR